MKAAALWVIIAGCAVACGGDDAGTVAENQCLRVADAFARAWERCGRDDYDGAYEIWESALVCDEAKSYDPDAVNQCVDDVDAQNCAAVMGNVSPSSCDDSALD